MSESHDAKPATTSPQWGEVSGTVARWPAVLAVFVGILLFFLLPDRFKVGLGPRPLIPALEFLLLVPLAATNMYRHWSARIWARPLAIGLVAVLNLVNIYTLGQLVYILATGKNVLGSELLLAGANIWLTNVLIFALWYWELDRGGPLMRQSSRHPEPDFLFLQMVSSNTTRGPWAPSFVDYLYVSYTNATAFSPTDTMPLTEWAKLLMMVQSAASLVTIGLVLARAVNILGH